MFWLKARTFGFGFVGGPRSERMYVCNCNGVTKREVEEAVTAGARCPEDVLAHHGCEPCCGRCLTEIAEDYLKPAGKEALVAAE